MQHKVSIHMWVTQLSHWINSNQMMFPLLYINAHPLRKPTLHRLVQDTVIPAAAEPLWETLESWNSKWVSFPSFFVFLLTLPSYGCPIGQTSLFETIMFSTALISKSQVEPRPAEGRLDSLSHSSLTHKQLVTHAAILFFCFTCQTILSSSKQYTCKVTCSN